METFGQSMKSQHLASEFIPVTDPALRLMVLNHLVNASRSRRATDAVRDDGGSKAMGTLARIGKLSIVDLTQLAKVVRAPTIGIGVTAEPADRACTPEEGLAFSQTDFDYVIRPDAFAAGTLQQIPVQDPSLRLMVLSQLISHLMTHAAMVSPAGGFAQLSVLERARQLSVSDLFQHNDRSLSPQIEIRVDIPNLELEVNRYHHMSFDQGLFDYFIKAEASTRMMAELFKATPTMVRKSQEINGIKPRTGRCSMPDEPACLEILAQWKRLEVSTRSLRERFHALHSHNRQYTMAQLYGVIKTDAGTCR
jgi:hypothetical protein